VNEVIFYKDRNGQQPVYEYLKSLAAKADKDSRIKLTKIHDYINVLRLYGTRAGYPYMKHLDGAIWELRPLRDRILFAGLKGGVFVLLHCFVKKTQKTPAREIEQAKRNLARM
jgi:phage-related protein